MAVTLNMPLTPLCGDTEACSRTEPEVQLVLDAILLPSTTLMQGILVCGAHYGEDSLMAHTFGGG